MPAKIEISHKTIIFTVIFLLLLWFIREIRDILYLLYISFILMSAVRPMVDAFERLRIPRVISILVVYILLLVGFGYLIGGLTPLMASQISRFVENFPKYEALFSQYVTVDLDSLVSQIAPIGENLLRISVGLFTNIFTVFTVLIITFYMLLERNRIDVWIKAVFTKDTGQRIIKAAEAVEYSLGFWLRGMVVLMIVVGLLTYTGLSFLAIEYAIALSIIAGILEIVPTIGPVISAVPAVIVGLTVSPFMGLAVAALFFIVQQVENNLIVPIVMNRAVGISPLILITALLIGSKLAGVLGAILAIPIVVTVRAILRSLFSTAHRD